MGIYKQLRELEKQQPAEYTQLWQERIQLWRKEPSTLRIPHPTRLARARSLGYKAKQGIVILRQRVHRGGHTRPQIKGGRRSKRFGTRLNLRKNYQLIAEERAQKKFPNLVVLNSYEATRDGKHLWYEIILVDAHHPVIQADPRLTWLVSRKRQSRVFHGQTSAGRKARGMRT